MTLLKGDKSIKKPMDDKRLVAPLPLTVMDGWLFGIGFWLALILAIPVILFILAVIAWVVIMIFGGLAGGLL